MIVLFWPKTITEHQLATNLSNAVNLLHVKIKSSRAILKTQTGIVVNTSQPAHLLFRVLEALSVDEQDLRLQIKFGTNFC